MQFGALAALAACCIAAALGSRSPLQTGLLVGAQRESLRPLLTSEWLGKKEGSVREVEAMFQRHQYSAAFQRGHVVGSSILADKDDVVLTPPPFTVVPPFTLVTTNGDLEIAAGEGAAYLFGLHHSDNFTQTLWFKSDLESAFAELPPKSHLVFVASSSDGAPALAELEALCQELEGFDAVQDRVHFVSDPLPVTCTPEEFPHCPMNEELEDGVATLAQAFASWGSYDASCSASWGEEGTSKALDCVQAGAWLPSVQAAHAGHGSLSGELALWGGDACGSAEPDTDVHGKVAVIERGTCSFFHKVSAAASRGARAVVIASAEPLSRMGCSAPDACEDAHVQIPAVMVSSAEAGRLAAAAENGETVTVSLSSRLRGERFIGLDHEGRLREVGQLRNHAGRGMAMVVKEAVGYAYEAEVKAALSEEDGRMVVTVAEGGEGPLFSGAAPVRGEAKFPAEEAMWAFSRMQVYLELQCRNDMDRSCGAWDYPVALKLCNPRTAVHPEPECTLEVGRWITPYGRRGQWLTDATALLPFVRQGGAREFVLEQPEWSGQEYRATVKLVLSGTGDDEMPLHTTVLFSGGAFDAHYNARHKPLEVRVPGGADRVELVAAVSGHGWGTDSKDCAEFCVSEHRFAVRRALRVDEELFVAKDEGTRSYLLADAGSAQGCADHVKAGVTPNQYGTWEYGRAGWCPGGMVQVWKGDVSNHLRAGMEGVVVYEGLVGGEAYSPQPCEGEQCASAGFAPEIKMQSLLVAYGRRAGPGKAWEGADEEAETEGAPLHPNGRPGGSAHTMKGAWSARRVPIMALQVSASSSEGLDVNATWAAVLLVGMVLVVSVGLVWQRRRLRGYWELSQ